MDAFLGLRHPKPPSIPSEAVYGALRGSGRLILTYRSNVIQFSPMLGRLLVALMLSGKTPVFRDDLIWFLYADQPNGGPENGLVTLGVFIWRLRKQLAAIGLGIIRRGWQGYVLEEIPCHKLDRLAASTSQTWTGTRSQALT